MNVPLNPNARLGDVPDEIIAGLLAKYNVPYDPKFKKVLFAIKPDLESTSVIDFLTDSLPSLIQNPLVKAGIAAIKRGAGGAPTPEPQAAMAQCPFCLRLHKVSM